MRPVARLVAPLSLNTLAAACRCHSTSRCRTAAAITPACKTSSSSSFAAAAADQPLSTTHRSFASLHRRNRVHGGIMCGVLRNPVRFQGSLQSLLEDPSDPYLPAITDVNLVRVAEIAEAGPRGSGRLAQALIRGQKLRQSPPPLASRPAQSEGEAVLQSLYEAGLERLKKAEAEAAEMEAEARATYEKLSDDEKSAIMRERWIAHMFDGLCATNAVLRMQIEDGAISPEEVDAAHHVYELVMKEAKPFASPERWRDDFVEEIQELAIMFNHINDARAITH